MAKTTGKAEKLLDRRLQERQDRRQMQTVAASYLRDGLSEKEAELAAKDWRRRMTGYRIERARREALSDALHCAAGNPRLNRKGDRP